MAKQKTNKRQTQGSIAGVTLEDVAKNDQTVMEWMKKLAADFRARHQLPEYCEEGIKALEILVEKMKEAYDALGVNLFTEQFVLNAIGYFGECLIKECGGEWTRYRGTVSNDPIAIRQGGNLWFPGTKFAKFVNNGEEDSLFVMYLMVKYIDIEQDYPWDENGEYWVKTPKGDVRLVNRTPEFTQTNVASAATV